MSTRSLTIMQAEGKEIAVLYRQMDGYPEGHGAELKQFLSGFEITNGLKAGKTANGGACLAAQIVAHFKEAPGGFYLYPAGTRHCSEEYIYTVDAAPGKPISLTCWHVYVKEYVEIP